MKNIVNRVKTTDYLTKSNLPASDYVINPYVGCLHGCKYCYACFMKRFTGHTEPWGTFIDIKDCDKPIDPRKIQGKTVFISSVTDCYNPIEEKEELTRKILKQLIPADADIQITTKSALVLRDLDILKQMKQVLVAMSINTLDEKFKDDMDSASQISERLNTLSVLHKNGIKTVLFMSPIFPEITDFKAIIERAKDFVDEFWFENLNLRANYKVDILEYIYKNYPTLKPLYDAIYLKGDQSYWIKLSQQITDYCTKNKIKYQIFFHHEQIRKNK